MNSFLEITCTVSPTSDSRWGYRAPKRPLPVPKTRDEMAAQMDQMWAELRTAILDGTFGHAKVEAGDPEGRDD